MTLVAASRTFTPMCNRAERGDVDKVRRIFGARVRAPFNEGSTMMHPRHPGIVVRVADGERVIEQMTWGFPLLLADARKRAAAKGRVAKPKPVNNARFDKLTSPFWSTWARDPAYRCLIPTARYAEAVGETGRMTETWLGVADQPIFAWAGLWRPTVEWGDSFTGVMTDNAPELAHIHDRSPVILDPEDWDTWLTAPLNALYRFDRPYPADRMTVDATGRLWGAR